MAMVRPVFKKGSRDRTAHYRPISLTCVACKIMESVVRNAMYDHLVVNSRFARLNMVSEPNDRLFHLYY